MSGITNYTPTPAVNQPSSEPIADETTGREQLIERLLYLLGGSKEQVNLWLSSPHPWLGSRTPMSYLDEGKIEVVETLVGAIEQGIPG
ncbi:MbcA/ParS/Xre antitoxin family protein [Argonema antarcticum]|uniref:MbcA/ParS/Xre antitoxin family protein n=1 Tax=Argonema antarcticum TaxID=2942763 RepID=UPI002011CDD2|nr:MbcA/ParS/Xre antitoxin family protein [Argonema antarcticum]MCL1474070.1 MbcA/ParS/Xre antitoxin family protein [Argonema antarcticum A004/B2]